MPCYQDDSGTLVVDPDGDILFAPGICADGTAEILICRPGDTGTPGRLDTSERTTAKDAGCFVRIRVKSAVAAAVIIEQASVALNAVLGMPPVVSDTDAPALIESLVDLLEAAERVDEDLTGPADQCYFSPALLAKARAAVSRATKRQLE